jgi:hypothetical protein
MMNPPEITPQNVIDRLAAGRPVTLEEPGWGDTGRGPCPTCGKPVQYFKRRPETRFYYGTALAFPHVCRQPLQAPTDSPKWLRLQQLQAELNALERSRDWTMEIDYDGRTRR